ncbi:hypothetical protein C3F09_05035 [candidate division GN15 bacterium]|uniref:Uncharacterized protein n=1 Tax=candidate division GN15 bacterium TaxID=2072418 RepID=A0A855X8H3_9BACT|nr:MAG: hypothetical protein C3F09_05035 [candidate division GN15 bacterium]
MIYSFKYRDAVIEFKGNRARAVIHAKDPIQAMTRARELFPNLREETVKARSAEEYVVRFKVAFNYRMSLLKSVERASRLKRSIDSYNRGRYVDRYIVAMLCRLTGAPEWLAAMNLKDEISDLRRAAVVAREVPNVMGFVDWDIAIYNFLELNSKPGHHSRVVRKVRA